MMNILFMIVLGYNLIFLAFWTYRFTSVIFRIHFPKLRKFQICSWLNHIEIKTYDEDLIEVLEVKNATSIVENTSPFKDHSRDERNSGPLYFRNSRSRSSSSSLKNAINGLNL